MKFKKIYFIINPASGNDEPILSWISDSLHRKDTEWEILVTKKAGDASRFAKKALKEKADLVAVYGGDGTIQEVSEVLFKKELPLAIIPGGTANVLAKELGIPTYTQSAVKLLHTGNRIKKIDMGICNGKPFINRINAGLLADMVEGTDRQMKDKIGEIAYIITAIKQLSSKRRKLYEMTLDGKKVQAKGISLVIANTGNVGVPNISFLPTITVDDGKLDVVVFKTKRIFSLIKWMLHISVGSIPVGVVKHWKVEKIEIKIPQKEVVIIDDVTSSLRNLTITVSPQSLQVLVPK